MRKRLLLAAVFALVACLPAYAQQQAPVYDNSYRGPVNYYGQPSYRTVPSQQQPRNQPPQAGIIPQAFGQVQQAGGFLRGLLPAPLRGGPEPSFIPDANPENLVITLVPGTPR